MTALVLVDTVLIALLTVLVAGLLRAYGTVLQRLHQLDAGSGGTQQFDLLPLARPMPALDGPGPDPLARPVAVLSADRAPVDAHDIAGETLDGQLVSTRIRDVEHDT